MDRQLLLFTAGVAAGCMNALAGGGSFIALPALIQAGLPSVIANASSTVALWPGGAASAWIYHDGAWPRAAAPLKLMLLATVLGGVVGAALLQITPVHLFDRLMPWLLLAATLALAFGRRIGAWLERFGRPPIAVVVGLQMLLGVYGGYYGGAVGMMMMAAWNLLGRGDSGGFNAPRTLMVTAANGAAVAYVLVIGIVRWPEALVLGCGAIVGGAAGARAGRRLPVRIVRAATLALCTLITIGFFIRSFV